MIGHQAPDFGLFSDEKEFFKLEDFRGKQDVVLLFFPAAFTGVCTTELNTVNNDIEAYGGAQVVGISTDTPFTLAEFKKVNGLRFPLLSDHNGTVAERYGAKYDHNFTGMKLDRIAKRSAFVVGKDGVIKYAEVLENAGDLPDLEKVRAAVASES